jgi:ribosome-associated heat shock protein Hsp15
MNVPEETISLENALSDTTENRVRLDKWLWAARFYRTRALAKAAIEGGKVRCRGERCKPSREPRLGEHYVIRSAETERTVVVMALSALRRAAPEAQTLYAETAPSLARREQAGEQRKAAGMGFQREGRPSKKQRRQWLRLHAGKDDWPA